MELVLAAPAMIALKPWLLAILVLAIAALVVACAHVPIILIPVALTHNIGLWADDDVVCVPEPQTAALYIAKRCLSMRAIRSLILAARVVDAGKPDHPLGP